jgi:hypothetical protein
LVSDAFFRGFTAYLPSARHLVFKKPRKITYKYGKTSKHFHFLFTKIKFRIPEASTALPGVSFGKKFIFNVFTWNKPGVAFAKSRRESVKKNFFWRIHFKTTAWSPTFAACLQAADNFNGLVCENLAPKE